MSKPKQPAQRPPTPMPMSTDSLEVLSRTLFAPNLKPPRNLNQPRPPSLAGSKLAPPWAELDERPAWRVRRFKLWRDNAPGLLLAVLDPRRRPHLKRYQSYALPPSPTRTFGVRAIPVLLNPKPDPAQPAPRRPLVLPRTPYPCNPGAKIPKWDRKARFQRLLQYKYVLDQEHERRFRAGMRALMQGLYDFERGNLREYSKWGRTPWDDKVDHGRAMQLTQFFKDIKKKSSNIFHHLQLAKIPIHPVRRREEVHRAVKAENKRRDKQRERKEAKKAAEEAAMAERAAAAEAEIGRAEADLFHRLIRAGVTEQDRAGELDELNAIRRRIAELPTLIEEHERAGELDELDVIWARVKHTQEQIAALKGEIARLEVEIDGEESTGKDHKQDTGDQHESGESVAKTVKPKKKRHRSKHKPKPEPAHPPSALVTDTPSDGGLTDASTISITSISTPTEVKPRPHIGSAKTELPDLAKDAKPMGKRPVLQDRHSAPTLIPNADEQFQSDCKLPTSKQPSVKRLTFRADSGPVASHELHDEVAQQLAQMIMAISRMGTTGQAADATPTDISPGPAAAIVPDEKATEGAPRAHRQKKTRTRSSRHADEASSVLTDRGPTASGSGKAENMEHDVAAGKKPANDDRPGTAPPTPPSTVGTSESAVVAPQPVRSRVSRLVNLDTDHITPPPSPSPRYVTPRRKTDRDIDERVPPVRSPESRPHSAHHKHPARPVSAVQTPSSTRSRKQHLNIDLAASEIIPELLDELSLSPSSRRPHNDSISVKESHESASDLDTTPPASLVSLPYADLNRDEDTAAIFASSAPRSDVSRLMVTTTDDDDDDDDSASNDSFATVRGVEAYDAGWTRGSDAASEPDTQITAQPLRARRSVYSS